MEAFSLSTAYMQCIGEQLLNALYDKGRRGKIYNGLVHYILAKHGGSNKLPRIKSLECYRFPTTHTLFLPMKDDEAHLKNTPNNFLLEPTPLETIWLQATSTLPHRASNKHP